MGFQIHVCEISEEEEKKKEAWKQKKAVNKAMSEGARKRVKSYKQQERCIYTFHYIRCNQIDF